MTNASYTVNEIVPRPRRRPPDHLSGGGSRSLRDDLEELAGDPVPIWRNWSSDVRAARHRLRAPHRPRRLLDHWLRPSSTSSASRAVGGEGDVRERMFGDSALDES